MRKFYFILRGEQKYTTVRAIGIDDAIKVMKQKKKEWTTVGVDPNAPGIQVFDKEFVDLGYEK